MEIAVFRDVMLCSMVVSVHIFLNFLLPSSEWKHYVLLKNHHKNSTNPVCVQHSLVLFMFLHPVNVTHFNEFAF